MSKTYVTIKLIVAMTAMLVLTIPQAATAAVSQKASRSVTINISLYIAEDRTSLPEMAEQCVDRIESLKRHSCSNNGHLVEVRRDASNARVTVIAI